jgi:hypothetical protein
MRKFLAALTALVVSGAIAYAANIPLYPSTPVLEPSQTNANFNNLIQQLNTSITPQSMAPWSTARNILDNGQMQVDQRVATTAITCGTTTIPKNTGYAADRWGCNVNVGSGAGSLQVVTTNLPTQPIFNNALLFYRTSGTLAQPQCVMQEIPTQKVVPLQGQPVTLSFYAYGLALMLAEQTTLNAYLLTGTGTDQGLQSFTASPAITPAWTGIASTQTTAFTLTSSYQRFTATYQMPAAAKEAAIALCWTPTTGGTAGATDGFEFTGVQLEQGLTASPFEYRSYNAELLEAEAYSYWIAESATSGAQQSAAGNGATTTTCQLQIPFPVVMRAAPTFYAIGTALSTATWTLTHVATATALATTYLVVLGANTPQGGSLTATVASGLTTGQTCVLTSANGGSIIGWSADF